MKILLLLTVVGLAASQFRRQRFRRPGFQGPQNQFSGGQVDDTRGGSQYHFSWKHDGGRKYTGGQAHGLCRNLGGGWQPVGISSRDELNYINSVVSSNRLEYIWTGGVRARGGFRWLNGEPFNVNGWSHTGGASRPQPDNRENGQENCLAVLNNFYGDGVTWHDVACHHTKAVICERRA